MKRNGRGPVWFRLNAVSIAICVVTLAVLPVPDLSGLELVPAPLRSIHVEGLRRTRETVILDLVPLAPGDLVTPAAVQATREEILDSEIFAEVSVTAVRPVNDPDAIDLRIVVREKWTLIPVPFFTTDGSSAGGGLILIESNLLGLNKQLITAGFGGSDGFSGFAAYVDPAVFGSAWNWRFSAATGITDVVHQLPDGSRIRDYRVRQNAAGTGIGYRFTRDIRATTGIRVTSRTFESVSIQPDGPTPTDGIFLEPDLSIRYDGTRPRGVLRLGPEMEIAARTVFGDGAISPGWEVSGQAGTAVPFITALDGRTRFTVSAGIAQMPPADKRQISARDGFRTLPYQRTVADRWFSSAAFLDLPVIRRSWGALVLSHYWEGGTFDDASHPRQYFGGPGGGFRVYLQEVAIPALGLDVAYNLVDPGVVFSFSLGARM